MMMMDDDDDDIGLHIPTQMIAKKKPPRLKSGDRTISVTIENYSPLTPATILLDKSERLRPSPIPKIKEFDKSKIFYTDESATIKYDDCPQHLLQTRPTNFRRSDTLNVREPSAYLLRKTHSFHSNETTVEDLLVQSRRGSSVRNSFVFPQEYVLDEPVIVVPTDTNRRSCRMHRSFVDQNKRTATNNQLLKKDAIKCHSFNEDVFADPSLKRKESKKFNSANVSLENDIYRSRSNSRNRKEDETFIDFVNRQNSKKYAPKLQQQQQLPQSQPTSFEKNYSFKRGVRHATSYYLTPDRSNEDIRRSPTTSSRSSFNDNSSNIQKTTHSASLKCRQNKENLSTTKKSKSFITEVHQNFDNNNQNLITSSYRKDSKLFITDEFNKLQPQQKQQLQKSPIMFTTDINNRSIEHRKSSINYDTNDIDYDTIIRSYRQNQIRRKSSIKLSSSINKRKSIKKKTSLTLPDDIIINDVSNNNNNDNEIIDNININDNDNIEMKRKRKKIVCIIMSVFLSLVFASVFVVVITLTHSSVAQVSNQTKKVYTFSRDSPIHYNGI